jgi:hypothetical protein
MYWSLIEIGLGVAMAFATLIWRDPGPVIKLTGLAVGIGLILYGLFGAIRDRSSPKDMGGPSKRWLPMWSLKAGFHDWPPFRRLIPVQEAANVAYEQLRQTLGIKMQEVFHQRHCGKPEGILGYIAAKMFGDGDVHLCGVFPPARKVEKIPDNHVREFMFFGQGS